MAFDLWCVPLEVTIQPTHLLPRHRKHTNLYNTVNEIGFLLKRFHTYHLFYLLIAEGSHFEYQMFSMSMGEYIQDIYE